MVIYAFSAQINLFTSFFLKQPLRNTVFILFPFIKQVATSKSLGITSDDKLCWNCRIEKLTKKIASGIGAMKRVRHLVPPATLHLTYQALIKPQFHYCSKSVVLFVEPVGLLYKTGCKNCRIEQRVFKPSL